VYYETQMVNVWMDNTQHFRNFETMATFSDLSKELGIKLSLNFFAEYHGKFECDRHFGIIIRMR
jgi:hypothetical protein